MIIMTLMIIITTIITANSDRFISKLINHNSDDAMIMILILMMIGVDH